LWGAALTGKFISSTTPIPLLENPAAEKGDPARCFPFLGKIKALVDLEHTVCLPEALFILPFPDPPDQFFDKGCFVEFLKAGQYIGQVEGIIPYEGELEGPELF
jgi:hypothetical protein